MAILDMANFVSRYISKLVDHTLPLWQLTFKDNESQLEAERQESFDEIKASFVELPFLRLFNTRTEVTFGLLLATTLKRLDRRTKALAQLKIQEVVFAAKFADPEQYFSLLYGVLVS